VVVASVSATGVLATSGARNTTLLGCEERFSTRRNCAAGAGAAAARSVRATRLVARRAVGADRTPRVRGAGVAMPCETGRVDGAADAVSSGAAEACSTT
jgi:hypothetical protein